MGSDLSEGAKIGIVLVILIFVVTIVLSLLMVVKNLTNTSATQLEASLDQMLNTTYDDYDQKIVSGNKVNTAIKLFSSEAISIVVTTGLCLESNINGGYCYGVLLDGYTSAGSDPSNMSYKRTTALTRNTGDTFFTEAPANPLQYNLNIKPLGVSGSDQFVRGNGKFLAELIRDTTGTIIGISFTQQAA